MRSVGFSSCGASSKGSNLSHPPFPAPRNGELLFLVQRVAERPWEGVCEGPTVWVAVIIDLGGWGPALGDPPTQ